MSLDKVQLSQEEYLGDQVTRTDINPVTNTQSVMDPDTGGDLKSVIDRLWSAINSALARVVNSVNGRDGIVVITANDVGLGNVDNVSFEDIKIWVLDQIGNAFSTKSIRLFATYQDLIDTVGDGSDLTLKGVPFYVEDWNADILGTMEHRSAIGYFYQIPNSDTISWEHRFINVINSTDGSIEYSHGSIGVKIHSDEVALQKDSDGLFIDPAFLSGNILFVNGFYDGATPLLLTNTTGTPVDIYLNDELIGADHYVNPSFTGLKSGVILITNWNTKLSGSSYTQGTDPLLMGRQPAMGRVEFTDTPVDKYTFKLYSIRSYVGANNAGYGLGYYFNPDNTESIKNNNLGVKFVETNDEIYGHKLNYSGLMACINGFPNPFDVDTKATAMINVTTPSGHIFEEYVDPVGLSIQTDDSLCIIPRDAYQPNSDWGYVDGKPIFYGSKFAKNWADIRYSKPGEFEVVPAIVAGDKTVDEWFQENQKTQENGYASTLSCLSVKLNKLQYSLFDDYMTYTTMSEGPYVFANISGLKIGHGKFGSHGFEEDDFKKLGLLDGKDTDGTPIDYNKYKAIQNPNYDDHNMNESGGLQINVGKYLEICPKISDIASEYDEGGKVQVRIGHGLQDEVKYVKQDDAFIPGTPGIAEYVMKNTWARVIGTDITIIPSIKKTDVITGEPEDWEHTYLDYYVRTGESPNYTYTKNTRTYDTNGTHPTYDVIIPTWEDEKYCLDEPNYSTLNGLISAGTLYRVDRTNRIAVDMDVAGVATYTPGEEYVAKQLVVDNYNLYLVTTDFTATDINSDKSAGYVVSVGGGGDSGPLRFLDNKGTYFDYNNPTSSPSYDKTVLQKKTVVKLGDGLKIVGGIMPQDRMLFLDDMKSTNLDIIDQISFLALKTLEATEAFHTDISEFTVSQVKGASNSIVSLINSTSSIVNQIILNASMVGSEIAGESELTANYNNHLYQSLSEVDSRITNVSRAVEASASKVQLLTKLCEHYTLTYDASKSVTDYAADIKFRELGWLFNEFTTGIIDPTTIPNL